MFKKYCIFLCCFVILAGKSFGQESEEDAAAREPTFFTDLGYSLLGGLNANMALNIGSRLGNAPFADVSLEDIGEHMTHPQDWWFWEKGDRFLVNNLLHPYHGGSYFASARINGFNFYESLAFVPVGSVVWEMFLEHQAAINDTITTTIGGIALGEMFHRLFLEADASNSIGAKIGAFVIDPMAGVNKLYNRKQREFGGGNIYELSVRTGVEKTWIFIPGHKKELDEWNYPGGYIDAKIVYGNPFIQESSVPYEHFELFAGVAFNGKAYNIEFISEGYIFSLNPVQTDTMNTSHGLSMHFDFFGATNDLIDNVGYGNLHFSDSAVGWTVKHQYKPSETYYIDIKVSGSAVVWGNSTHFANTTTDDYWVDIGNMRHTYGMGGSIKTDFTFFHAKAGRLDISAQGYYIASVPINNNSTGNVFFLHSSASYEFPITAFIGIGARGTFWGLLGLYNSAENINRRLVSSSLYVRFTP